ncbi:MAG: tetratricopeptide (TPR) repeat protein [Planctomycetota bacterium]|jgi:tetratricopeptide (TPR) repeat protein
MGPMIPLAETLWPTGQFTHLGRLGLGAFVLSLGLLVGACGDAGDGSDPGGATAGEGAQALVLPAMVESEPRSQDPRLIGARKALAAGQGSSARTQLDQLAGAAGVEGLLCEARLALWRREVVEAMAAVERARALAPADSRVFATNAEILASTDRDADAEIEIQAGIEVAGLTPDLRRAQGVRMLFQSGRGPMALALLEAAMVADPDLPYMDWPLSQAYLLTARADLGQAGGAAAIEHALMALKHDSGLSEAYVVLGDGYSGVLDFTSSLESYRMAAEAGMDVERELVDTHLRAGMAARMLKDHRSATHHYLAARDFGLSDLELSSGVDYLASRASLAMTQAGEADIAGDFELAEDHLEEALNLDPSNLDALDHLGNLRFRGRRYNAAAVAWEVLVGFESAAGQGKASETHLNLGRALVLASRAKEARGFLQTYLDKWPDGPFADETRQMLKRLPVQ